MRKIDYQANAKTQLNYGEYGHHIHNTLSDGAANEACILYMGLRYVRDYI